MPRRFIAAICPGMAPMGAISMRRSGHKRRPQTSFH
jgi:hypothetical protein